MFLKAQMRRDGHSDPFARYATKSVLERKFIERTAFEIRMHAHGRETEQASCRLMQFIDSV